ncbi:MAG TPA: hypothetical protein VFQ38_21015 [Longimicrobiales bacterium]|nr:hypothetical protein [Longimicrobiales bacterium]
MDRETLRATITEILTPIRRGETDFDVRDESDAFFRERYLAVLDEPDLPDETRYYLREALLALVGDDDWRAAGRYLEEALERS